MNPFELFGFSHEQHQHPEANSKNPSDFPRSAEITDDDLKMAITQMASNDDLQGSINKRLLAVVEELNIARAERVVMESKFWREIRERFPNVAIDTQCGIGYRKWADSYYVVSWGGHHDAHNQPQGGTTPLSE